MERITVYRVEDHAGEGAYRSGLVYKADIELDDRRHPGPDEEWGDWHACDGSPYGLAVPAAALGCHPNDLLFGFTSREQMRVWWTAAEQARLEAAGGVLRAYRVPADRVYPGRRQVVFDRNSVVSKRRIPFTNTRKG